MFVPPCDSEQFWGRIEATKELWLFLDYDGTLAEFAPTPDHIEPDRQLITLISSLVGQPDLRVSVISGRRLSHIQQLLPVSGLMIAGTYGVELNTWEGESISRVDVTRIRPTLDDIKQSWQTLLSAEDGFYLEDKGWAIAIHGRYANSEVAERVLAQAQRLAEITVYASPVDTFRILGGSTFLEVGPTLAHKGRTLEYLFRAYPAPEALPIYLGDDDKDEEAFSVVKAHGGIALVVSSVPRPTLADCRLVTPADTRRWLGRLLQIRQMP